MKFNCWNNKMKQRFTSVSIIFYTFLFCSPRKLSFYSGNLIEEKFVQSSYWQRLRKSDFLIDHVFDIFALEFLCQ